MGFDLERERWKRRGGGGGGGDGHEEVVDRPIYRRTAGIRWWLMGGKEEKESSSTLSSFPPNAFHRPSSLPSQIFIALQPTFSLDALYPQPPCRYPSFTSSHPRSPAHRPPPTLPPWQSLQLPPPLRRLKRRKKPTKLSSSTTISDDFHLTSTSTSRG